MTKIIYTAIAAPGSGKTQALINQLINYINSGEKVVIALPTRGLSKDILDRMKSCGINPKLINSDEHPGNSTHVINGTLRCGSESVVIITHEGLRLSNPRLLRNYILVIDEVPSVFDFYHTTNLSSTESDHVLSSTYELDHRLYIKPGLKTQVEDRVKTYKAAQKNKSTTSTLSAAEYKIFNCILSNGIVHFETFITPHNQKQTYNFHAIENKDIFKYIEQSKETHILAANIVGGIFDIFAKNKKFQFKRSRFTPDNYEYNCEINIYPLLTERWSKNQVLQDEHGNSHPDHLGQNNQLIDKIFFTALNNTPNEHFIAVTNSWAKFNEEYFQKNNSQNIEFPQFDCRGLNTHTDKTAAVLLFTGNPSPCDTKSLQVLAKEHGINYPDLRNAWTVTKKLEAALQAVTRTAIRVRGNTKPVYFYVQDFEVAEYLQNTYMPNARIDHSLALSVPQRKDNRSHLEPNDKNEMFAFIRHELEKGVKRSKIVKAVVNTWEYSESQARKFVKNIVDSIKAVRPIQDDDEGLSRFFV